MVTSATLQVSLKSIWTHLSFANWTYYERMFPHYKLVNCGTCKINEENGNKLKPKVGKVNLINRVLLIYLYFPH